MPALFAGKSVLIRASVLYEKSPCGEEDYPSEEP